MRRYLALVGVIAILIMAAADAIWPAPTPLLIDAAASAEPGAWPRGASAEACLPPPAPAPNVRHPWQPVERGELDHRSIA